MTDIIANAKRLLEGATPGPWSFQPWSKYTGPNGDYEESALLDSDGETLCDGLPDSEGELIAAAPALAELVAEETWEYGIEIQWLTLDGPEWRLDADAGWHKSYRDAEHAADPTSQTRIVRRRVSPVEVME